MLGHTKPLTLCHARLATLSAKFGAPICGRQSDRSGLREEGFVGDSWEGRLVGELGLCGWELVAVTCHMGTTFNACQHLPARPHGLPEQNSGWELSTQVHELIGVFTVKL